jgi:hypothetical protein
VVGGENEGGGGGEKHDHHTRGTKKRERCVCIFVLHSVARSFAKVNEESMDRGTAGHLFLLHPFFRFAENCASVSDLC